ncbi:MAG TPA: LysR family transcriptional regulator, partial [Plasticicumulans sp.]|nr:LysR family transcriptional regulator [Plasticicumulans sp.]
MALFVCVVEAGGMSAAARALGLSTQIVSQRVQRLEARIGVRLLHRTTRQLQPTEAGERFLRQARALVEDAGALLAGFSAERDRITGTLRMTLPASFGQRHVAPLLPEFLALHPQLALSLRFSDRLVDLVAGGLDLGIRIGTLTDSTLASRRLAANRRLLCASPAYLARAGQPQDPEALSAHECLVLVDGSERQDDWRLFGPGGRVPERRGEGGAVVVGVRVAVDDEVDEVAAGDGLREVERRAAPVGDGLRPHRGAVAPDGHD